MFVMCNNNSIFFQTNELAIGNFNGELLIFKGSSGKPWAKCGDLGTVSFIPIK